jgi:hypothetical protein
MSFDEDLKRAFDALSDRLHAEVQHQIDAAVAELRAATPVVEPVPVVRPEPSDPKPTSVGEDLTPLVSGMRAMDEARSLTDVLDAFATAAAQHARGAAVILRRRGRHETWRAIGVEEPFDATDATWLPLTVSGEPIGDLYAEGGSPDALEILTRHAARTLEAMTAFKTARALARQADAATGAHLNEEDASAQRYAKLLVSEIKLYHESDVVAGRRERDLTSRLGGEIARARVLYDQRVPPHVRQRADYFHDELVRTLANGDSTLLEFQA